MTKDSPRTSVLRDAELIARLRDAVSGEHDMTPHGADVLQAADRIEALTEQLTAARQDAKEAEAYAEELEDKLAKAMEESKKYERAFAAQSRKLQAVLHIEGVKATLAEIKGESHDVN